MERYQTRRLIIAGIALLTVPFSVFAQNTDNKDKTKNDKVQQIVITRNSNQDQKLVIEVNGDKVLVNGKDAKDNKDVSVHVNTSVRGRYRTSTAAQGMSFDNLTLFSEDENRAMLGIVTEGDDRGAEIRSITKESGAEKAGLKKGDVITKIGDTKIETTDDVTEAIHARKPGDKVGITYLRDGKEQKVTAELGKWKGISMSAVTVPSVQAFRNFEAVTPSHNYGNGTYIFDMNRPKLGISVQDTDDGKGAKITDVDDDSNASKAGLKTDDVITNIDDVEIHGTDDVVRATRSAQKDKFTFVFKVNRNGKSETINVNVPRHLKTADL